MKLEQEILDSQTENAILLANAQHQRQEVLSQIEKVCGVLLKVIFQKMYKVVTETFEKVLLNLSC